MQKSCDDLSNILASLSPAPKSQLISLYRREPQLGEDGILHSIDATTRISPEEGLEIMTLARAIGARSLLEVGLAYGFSTQFLLASLDEQGGGRLVSVDPFQLTNWHGIGRRLAESTVAASPVLNSKSFHWISERSDWACLQMERSGEQFDLIFIDGYHRFDDVLTDVTLGAKICRQEGIIILHDMWLPSVQAVVSFLHRNRTDLEPIPCSCPNIAAFRRISADDRSWDHFYPFETQRKALEL